MSWHDRSFLAAASVPLVEDDDDIMRCEDGKVDRRSITGMHRRLPIDMNLPSTTVRKPNLFKKNDTSQGTLSAGQRVCGDPKN